MTEPTNPEPVVWAANQVALASALGVDRKSIGRWLKEDGNPGRRSDGRYSIPEWAAWVNVNGKGLTNNRLNQTELKARQIQLQNKKLEFQISILKREFVAVSDVERWTGENIANAKKVLLGGPSGLAPQLVGVTVPEAEKLLREWLAHALEQLAQMSVEIGAKIDGKIDGAEADK